MKASLRDMLAPILLVCVVGLLFLPSVEFSYLNFDDNLYIYENPMVLAGLSWDGIQWAFSTSHGGHWHPLSWIMHMVLVDLFGAGPFVHHIVSITLHAANVLLLFLLIKRLTGEVGLSLFVVAVFGVHPLRLESVAWASQLKDVLSMFFCLAVMNLYVSAVRSGTVIPRVGGVVLFALGVLAKPTIVTLPVLLLLLDYWPLSRKVSLQRLLLEKLPFFAISFGCGVMTLLSQGQAGALKDLSGYTLDARIANVLVGYTAYIGKLVWPSGLSIFYPFTNYPSGVAPGAALLLVGVSVVCWQARRSHPYLLFGWSWFVISLLPTIGLIQVGGQAFANRWAYLPHIGLLVSVAFVGKNLIRSVLTKRLVAVSVVFLFAGVTYRLLPTWQNSEEVFRYSLKVSPDNFMAHTNLGTALDRKGDLDGAIPHFKAAVRLRPRYPVALNNLGGALARKGDQKGGMVLFDRALKVSPTFVPALYNFGLSRSFEGRQIAALRYWLQVLELDPGHNQVAHSLRYASTTVDGLGCDNQLSRATVAELLSVRERLRALKGNTNRAEISDVLDLLGKCLL